MFKKESSRQNLTLPHSIELELAVIGGILVSPNIAQDIVEQLKPEYFFEESHRCIVETIVELVIAANTPDLVTVAEHLRRKTLQFDLIGYEGLKNFMPYSMDPSNIGSWLEQVKYYWELRQIVEKCSSISAKGRQIAGADIPGFLQEVEAIFMQLSDARISGGLRPASDICMETVQELERIIDNPQAVTGIPSGFTKLDEITSGFQPSDLIILAARPAMGKTALALNFAAHAALKHNKYVAFFSLEMSSSQLMQRLLAMQSSIDSKRFRTGQLDGRDFDRLYDAVKDYQIDKIMFDDTPSLSLLDLASRCRKMKREKKHLDLILIDYLQLMTGGPSFASGKNSREREIGFISMGLKALAKELKCPVIALAQLNRDLEKRVDRRPKPADLRESGSIEQDADQIMFVYRDEVYNKDSPDKGIAEVIIGKNRHGELGFAKVAFDSKYTRFHNLAHM